MAKFVLSHFFMQNIFAGIVIVITGTALIIGSVVNWKPLFENRKAGFFSEKFGPNTDRIIYGIIGLVVVLMGIYILYSGKLNPENQ